MLDSLLGVHEAALTFKARRMEVLAENLANADTPQYKARDIEFAAVLARQRVRPFTTHARHIGPAAHAGGADLKYRVPHQPALDGNTVETDQELARYTENAVGYQASLLFVSGRIATLRTALSGARS